MVGVSGSKPGEAISGVARLAVVMVSCRWVGGYFGYGLVVILLVVGGWCFGSGSVVKLPEVGGCYGFG